MGFKSLVGLNNHLKSISHYKITGQSLEKEKRKCICNYSDRNREFFNEILLQNHKRTTHSPNVSVVTCEDCGYVGRKSNMANHKKVDHSLQELCLLCADADKKIYKTRIALSQHIQSSHEDERECKECGFETESVQQLLVHLKTVKHKRTFMCEDCAQDFLSQSRLRRHQEEEHGLKRRRMI